MPAATHGHSPHCVVPGLDPGTHSVPHARFATIALVAAMGPRITSGDDAGVWAGAEMVRP